MGEGRGSERALIFFPGVQHMFHNVTRFHPRFDYFLIALKCTSHPGVGLDILC